MKIFSKSLGFTLVEALVTAVILSFMIGAIYTILNIENINYSVDSGLLNLEQQARQGMEWLIKETRQASLVNITNGGATITFNTPNANGIKYYLNNNSLVREYPPGTTKIVANNLSSLNFSQSVTMLTIKITASKTVLLRPLSFSLTQQVRLRNE